jgi:DeoR/GlpR family transcriptional regulator of sugar metabolism
MPETPLISEAPVNSGLLAAADELAAEQGVSPDEVRRDLREMDSTVACMVRRVLFVAVRQ